MLKSFDFSITKSSTCELTICDLIDTQTSPAQGDGITYNLVVPPSQVSDIDYITSIDVTKFNACDDSFNPINFTILPVNEEPGNLTYGTLAIPGGSTMEYLVYTHSGYEQFEIDNLTNITLNVKRGNSVIFTESVEVTSTAALNSRFFTGEAEAGQLNVSSILADGDIAEIVVLYNNGVTVTTSYNITLSSGTAIIGGNFSLAYQIDMAVDSSNLYEINDSDCILLSNISDSFGDWDGIWSVRFKVNYVDHSGNDRHIITTKCSFVNCDSNCDAVDAVATLLKNDPNKSFELALTKQAIEWAMDCDDCCAACDALYLYNNRIKGNCKSC